MATAGPVEVEQLGDTLPPGERPERALLGGLLEGENTHPIMHLTAGHVIHPTQFMGYLIQSPMVPNKYKYLLYPKLIHVVIHPLSTRCTFGVPN